MSHVHDHGQAGLAQAQLPTSERLLEQVRVASEAAERVAEHVEALRNAHGPAIVAMLEEVLLDVLHQPGTLAALATANIRERERLDQEVAGKARALDQLRDNLRAVQDELARTVRAYSLLADAKCCAASVSDGDGG